MKVVVLVSCGRNSYTRRFRRAPNDARALEMALRFPGAQLSVVHAGDAENEALRPYLGMGLPTIEAMELPTASDPLPCLVERIAHAGVDLVLTGVMADAGESSGMLPYALAEILGWPLLPQAASITTRGRDIEAIVALPRGQRRRLLAQSPAIITVGPAGPKPRMIAFASMRRGRIDRTQPCVTDTLIPAISQSIAPARPMPKFIEGVNPDASPEERLKAITAASEAGGIILRDLNAESGAQALLDYLRANKVVRSP